MKQWLGVLMVQLFFLSPCWANQVKNLLPDETVSISISNQHLNRLKISNDKIVQVIGHEGEYQFKTDLGELFIQPQLHQPITIFIKTEKQLTYGLVLVPKSSLGSQTIILQSSENTASKQPASLNDAVHFLKVLEEKKLDVGSAHVESRFEKSALPEIEFRLIDSVKNNEQFLVGHIYELKNKKKATVALIGKEPNFANPKTMLMQFQAIELKPYQTTLLYQVNHAR